MIDSTVFISFLEKNFQFITGVPCSYFKEMLVHLAADETNCKLQHIIATREDEAMGIASGVALSGKRALVYMQNSGFANVGDALTSLAQLYKLPMLILISYRGLEPDSDYPEHSLMGEVTEPLLTAYNIPYFDLTEDNWETIMKQALQEMEQISAPVALLIRPGVLNQ